MKKLITLQIIVLCLFNQKISAQCWLSIASGARHNAAISKDSTLHTWGINTSGQLGTGNNATFSAPQKIDVNNKYIKVACGNDFTLAIRKDGSLWGFGLNTNAQLGLGNYSSTNTITRVGTDNDWVNIAAGNEFAIGIKSNGTTYSWGTNLNGQLGYGFSINRSTTPIQININNIKSIACGDEFTIVLKNDGTIWSWGYNGGNQLGYTSANPFIEYLPKQIGNANNWTAIAAGNGHSLFVNNDGELYTCGFNTFGQTGIGSTSTNSTLTKITNITKAKSVGAGWNTSFVVDSLGDMYSSGRNNISQIGLTLTQNYPSFTKVTLSNLDSFVLIDGGEGHSLFLNSKLNLYTIGWNNDGQLGTGNSANQSSLYLVNICSASSSSGTSGSTTNLCWIQASANNNASYAIKGDSSLWFWGGMLNTTPVQIGNSKWAKVSVGINHSLFIKNDGTLWAEGNNQYGQLGLSNGVASSSLVQIGVDSDWKEIAAGNEFSLALKNDGTLYSTGRNNYYQCGDGLSSMNKYGFTLATAIIGTSFIKIAVGYSHVLAIDNAGNCYTWGRNNAYQLGNNSNIDRGTPVKIISNIAKEVAAGEGHSACVTTTGLLYTWGWNANGQVGNNSINFVTSPVLIGGSPNTIRKVSCGAQFTFCINDAKQLYGWGSTTDFRLNASSASIGGTAVLAPRLCATLADTALSISSGLGHTLLTLKNGQMYSWGMNTSGQLGIGTLVSSASTQLPCLTSTLPLKLEKFTIETKQNMHELSWVTSNEINVDGFEIQKSLDGRNFEKISFIFAKNSLSKNYYNYSLNTSQNTYYRLKMIDDDGKFSYSKTLFIQIKNNSKISVFPNPVTNYFSINSSEKINKIKLTDYTGKIIKILQPSINNVDVSDLKNGYYFLQIQTDNLIYTEKIIKK